MFCRWIIFSVMHRKISLRRSQYIRKLPYIPTCLIMNSHMREENWHGIALKSRLFSIILPGETDRLQERICGAWINFARYGNPSVPSLPQWPVCEPGKEAIMIFDNICEVKDNYDHRLMELLVKHAPAFTVPLDEDAENVFMH